MADIKFAIAGAWCKLLYDWTAIQKDLDGLKLVAEMLLKPEAE